MNTNIPENMPRRDKGHGSQSISDIIDSHGRSVVVVKQSRRHPGPLSRLSGSFAGSPADAGKAKIAEEEKEASVFRSWAMPEE